jgi:GAF domain-containing protein
LTEAEARGAEDTDLAAALASAREQQAAVSDILRVISRSKDLQEVFDVIATSARRFCSAEDAMVALVEGDQLVGKAHDGEVGFVVGSVPLDRQLPAAGCVVEGRTVHVRDIQTDPSEHFKTAREIAVRYGIHTVLATPMFHDGKAIGSITLRRTEARPFTDEQIELVRTFADQAVIAIENVRLFNETKEALDQQTATNDVLKAISRSAFDLQAVFNVVLENATKLCRGEWAWLFRRGGDVFRLIAWHGGSAALLEYERSHPTAITDRTLIGRVALRRSVVHIPDLFEDPNYDWPSNREEGVHTVLGVPIFRDGEVVGAIGVARGERRPFSDAEIRLVQTFADQATIAMENVRLFNETKESLGQQTALSDVLRTISRSAFDLDAVLQTIVERAAGLVGAESSMISRREGDEAVVLAGFGPALPVAGAPGTRIRVSDGTLIGRALMTGKRQYTVDATLNPELPQGGPRTRLVIPFMRDGKAVGTLGISHNLPRPFSDRELQMLETFADQAAIAIENVRLFNEKKEALERQTAVSEILRVIASSPSDQQPVFDAIALNATRYCGAADALVLLVDGDKVKRVAHHGTLETVANPNLPLVRTAIPGRAILDRRTVQVSDITGPEGDEFPTSRLRASELGDRGLLATPFIREGKGIGAILLRRRDTTGFTASQVQLVEAFADQAVIAIENVRLFNETKEALKQRTATSEILRVISETLGDPQPVMQAIVDTVLAVCSADSAGFFRRSGVDLILRAVSGTWRGPRPSDVGPQLPFHGDSIVVSALEEGRYQHVADTSADPRYDAAAQWSRTRLAVPVLRGTETIGVIRVGRTEPGGFTEREIRLVEGFADQAAIAFENARLFNETKEALERQSAVAQVLGEISQSGFQLQPVLESVIEAATKLCAAQQGFIYRRERDAFRLVVAHGITPEFKAFTEVNPINPMGRGTVTGRVAEDRKTVHIPDVLADPEYTYWEAQRLGNFRAILGVPMTRDDEVIGVMLLWRTEPQPFTDEQITLVTTFANQATIAIENVRLFDETKEALEQQTAVGEVLKAISRSAFDLDPILGTVVENAARMADADFAWIARREKGELVGGARYASDGDTTPFAGLASVIATARSNRTGESISARVLNTRRTIHIEDITLDTELAAASPVAKATGSRTVLAVPLLAEGEVIGAILVTRRAVRGFTEREVKVVETFADQAAIAIQNVRLFNEIQDKSRQLEIANRHKSEFLANMSHELRTPLNAIIGFSEVLVQGLFGDVNEKQREYLQDVIGSGQHLLSLINDILDLSKIEAGRMELELSTFHFRDALQSGVTIVRERASRHNITLSVTVADELGSVEADERKVKQIFYNLLSNAVKFTPDGGRVDVAVRRDHGDVRVEVRDNGIGIADSDQARIFEEFQQVGRERSREGTGLGLTLTKRFVELHGGRIWLESAPERGSTFTFTLPLRRAAPVRA